MRMTKSLQTLTSWNPLFTTLLWFLIYLFRREEQNFPEFRKMHKKSERKRKEKVNKGCAEGSLNRWSDTHACTSLTPSWLHLQWWWFLPPFRSTGRKLAWQLVSQRSFWEKAKEWARKKERKGKKQKRIEKEKNKKRMEREKGKRRETWRPRGCGRGVRIDTWDFPSSPPAAPQLSCPAHSWSCLPTWTTPSLAQRTWSLGPLLLFPATRLRFTECLSTKKQQEKKNENEMKKSAPSACVVAHTTSPLSTKNPQV